MAAGEIMNPVPEGNITVRRLPDLDPYPAVEMRLEGRHLQVEMESEASAATLASGNCLVEVDSAEMVYLGEVCGCHGNVLAVHVNHALDRDRLSRVQEAWSVQGQA
jgi:hypothetical protein